MILSAYGLCQIAGQHIYVLELKRGKQAERPYYYPSFWSGCGYDTPGQMHAHRSDLKHILGHIKVSEANILKVCYSWKRDKRDTESDTQSDA